MLVTNAQRADRVFRRVVVNGHMAVLQVVREGPPFARRVIDRLGRHVRAGQLLALRRESAVQGISHRPGALLAQQQSFPGFELARLALNLVALGDQRHRLKFFTPALDPGTAVSAVDPCPPRLVH